MAMLDRSCRFPFGIVLPLLLSAVASLPAAASPAPGFADGRGRTFLPFLNAPAPGAEMKASPRLGLSFGGETHPVLTDTGSTGIVVSASRIPNVDRLPARPGRLTYSSSGRIMVGRWVTVPVTVSGRDAARVRTAPIPVLAVDRIECTNSARDCTPEDRPEHVAMMGIGFGREYDSQSESTPETNPLLNVAPDGSQPLHRGYIVTRGGIQVGLGPADAQGGFRFVKLDPHPSIAGEWQGVPVCIRVNEGIPACGRALLDTGVTAMFLTLPKAAVADALDVTGKGLAPATRLALSFPGASPSEPAASYTIAVGDDASPLAPSGIHLNTTRPDPFVNTGLHVLNGFDLLYDAEGGFFGFRPLGGP